MYVAMGMILTWLPKLVSNKLFNNKQPLGRASFTSVREKQRTMVSLYFCKTSYTSTHQARKYKNPNQTTQKGIVS